MAMEAEAESTALLVGNDKLENKFAALEAGSGGWQGGRRGGLHLGILTAGIHAYM
jgi:hypothetical protein